MASADHPGREVVVFPGSVSSHIRARCGGGWDGDKVAADLHDAPAAVGGCVLHPLDASDPDAWKERLDSALLIRRGGLRDGTARFQKGGFREDDALFLHQVVPVPEE